MAKTLTALLFCAALGAAAPALAQSPPVVDWRAATDRDIDFAADIVANQSIMAVYPDPDGTRRALDDARARAHREAAQVRDVGGHHAVLQHFIGAFQDAHARIGWTRQPTEGAWPGFLLRYQNGAYLVTGSQTPGVADGAPVTACDGRPIQALIDRYVDYEVGLPATLDAIRVTAASQLLVDQGDPFVKPPATCVVAGQTTPLTWRTAPMRDLAPLMVKARPPRVGDLTVRPFGDDGAWVKLGIFATSTQEQADAYRALIAQLPSLRDKKVVVLDVRGNGGGPYDWFMAVLRGLYGQPYADHYAVARLQISNVWRATPEIIQSERDSDAKAKDVDQPEDPPRRVPGVKVLDGLVAAQARGEAYYRQPKPPKNIGPQTSNPVKARVIVLTDTGCGSACIAFVDEMKLFPGVIQVGWPTYVDSRTGTPYSFPLPSGTGSIRVPAMTRDGRVRGDNEPQIPDRLFKGDVGDTAAVEAWINDVVLKAR